MSDEHKPPIPQHAIIIKGSADIEHAVSGTLIVGADARSVGQIAAGLDQATAGTTEIRIEEGAEARIGTAVAGLQLLIARPQDLVGPILELENQVNDAIANGELSADQAEDAKKGVERAKEEISKSQPAGQRIVDSLKRVNDIFEEVMKAGGNLAEIGKVVLKAAPYAAALLEAARVFFGL